MCFPQAYLPGLRGVDIDVLPLEQAQQALVLQTVAQWARTYTVTTIFGMERLTAAGRQIAAVVIDAQGQVQGYQTKNQLAPSEEQFYVLGYTRQLFAVSGIKHAAWRKRPTLPTPAPRSASGAVRARHVMRRPGYGLVRARAW